MCRLPCLPGGYICYNTNIIQATNEFLKSTIKGETTPAADIALALASLPATYTSNIPSCCFASIKFSIKSGISSKSSPWGGDKKKKEVRDGGNSHVQLRGRAASLCAGLCVCLQRLTDSIIMESAIICSHQSNIKAITCVSAFSVVIKANSTAIYLRCVNITAFSPSLCLLLCCRHHTTEIKFQRGRCVCVCGGCCGMHVWHWVTSVGLTRHAK